jgi:hypothetical protein
MIPIAQVQERAAEIAQRATAGRSAENDQVLALALIAQMLVHINSTLTAINNDLLASRR